MGIKILLADDSVTAQNMGKKILSDAGHEVVTVSNGAAAAKKIAEINPELVLLDVFMPGYSGLELCERLRNAAATSKLPVLLTVGRMEPYSPQDGARVKADGVIVKPFEATDLTAAVERIAEKLKPSSKSAIKTEEATPATHDPTERLETTQIAAILKNGAAGNKSGSAASVDEEADSAATAADKFRLSVSKPPLQDMPTAAMPAFGSELEPKKPAAEPAAVPSYMAQYLADPPVFGSGPSHSESKPSTPGKSSAPALKIESAVPEHFEVSTSPSAAFAASGSNENVLQRFETGAKTEPPVASADGLELTAAPPVGELEVVREPGFEATHQRFDVPAAIPKDPAFESDPHRSTMDFPTHFATSEATASDLPLPAQVPSASPSDEFEARLQAAISAYEEPSTDLPLATSSDIHAEAPIEIAPQTSESFDSRFEAAIHAFDAAGEPPIEVQPHASAEVNASEPEIQLEKDSAVSAAPLEIEQFAPVPAKHPVPQFESGEETSVLEPLSSGTIEHEAAESIKAPEPDEIVIEQMRESFSSLPVESGHMEASDQVPMAMAAAAASTSAPAGHVTEIELARAVVAAVSGDQGANSASSTQLKDPASPADANKVAAAVEKVMQQELPGLIWKIMAELELKK